MQSYSRHKLKEDRFQESAKEAVTWTVEHRKNVTGAIVAAVVAVLVAIGIYFYLDSRDNSAATAMGEAMRTFNEPVRAADQPADPSFPSFATVAERGKAAAAQFKDIADKYSSTATGKKAAYMAGIALKDAGDKAGAEAQLKKVSDSGNADLKALARMALASLYVSNDRGAEAVSIYKDLILHPTSTVPKQVAQFELAAYYQTKQPDEAKRMYTDLQKDDSPAVQQLARARLAEMGGK